MDEEGGNPTFLSLLDYMRKLHIAKARGYSGAGRDTWKNFRRSAYLGMTALQTVLSRLGDKEARLENLYTGIPSTLRGQNMIKEHIDAASYHLIAASMLGEDSPEDLIIAMSEVLE